MSKYVVYRTVVKVIDGKNMVNIEPVTCDPPGHMYQHATKTGHRKGLPKLNERCVCGAEYWGIEDDLQYFEALENGRVNVK